MATGGAPSTANGGFVVSGGAPSFDGSVDSGGLPSTGGAPSTGGGFDGGGASSTGGGRNDGGPDGPYDAPLPSQITQYNGGAITLEEFQLPGGHEPLGIALGADGNTWFVDRKVDSIGRITPSGVLTEFPMPSKGLSPEGMAAGPSGDLWYASVGVLGHVDMSGSITEYPIDSISPLLLAVDADNNLWFTGYYAGFYVVKRATDGSIQKFPNAALNYPGGMTFDLDGNVWLTDQSGIVRMTPAGAFTSFPLFSPFSIAMGPDGNLWAPVFASDNPTIARISPSGTTIDSFPAGGASYAISYISAGPDGYMWFTEGDKNPSAIGRISVGGVVEEFPLPNSGSYQMGFAVGPGRTLWFSEGDIGKVGKITLQP
jgi:streptogramin lyase